MLDSRPFPEPAVPRRRLPMRRRAWLCLPFRGARDALTDERTSIPVGAAPPAVEAPAEPDFGEPDGYDGGNGYDGGDGDGGEGGSFDEGRAPRPRVYKLRLALIVGGLATLAFVSTVFGMLMAVASDLPALENRQEYQHSKNSILLDTNGQQIGVLTGRENRILIQPGDIAATMQHAIIAIEDKRFFENNGIDIRGIGRALFADLTRQKAVQGASTITQQFVKNALAAQNKRTIFEKLREAALAYHLTRKWSKQKILTEYLNTVYFGNGAYGIESAARTYFGFYHPGCGNQGQPYCASSLTPPEAALLAGMVASPAAWDPLAHPLASKQRRNVVLGAMLQGGTLTRGEYDQAINAVMPNASTITLPKENSQAPYFTSWVKQQVIDKFGAQRALAGGLKIRTTLDLQLQAAADQAVLNHLTNPNGPAAALVAIDNRTGAVRAMVGGRPVNYNDSPFNLATQGQRQPGSSFKIFVLAQALRSGTAPTRRSSPSRRSSRFPTAAARRSSSSTTSRGRTPACARSPTPPRSPTTPSSPRWASRSACRRSPTSPRRWASARPSRTTRRFRSAASSRASRRSTWRTPTRRSPPAAAG